MDDRSILNFMSVEPRKKNLTDTVTVQELLASQALQAVYHQKSPMSVRSGILFATLSIIVSEVALVIHSMYTTTKAVRDHVANISWMRSVEEQSVELDKMFEHRKFILRPSTRATALQTMDMLVKNAEKGADLIPLEERSEKVRLAIEDLRTLAIQAREASARSDEVNRQAMALLSQHSSISVKEVGAPSSSAPIRGDTSEDYTSGLPPYPESMYGKDHTTDLNGGKNYPNPSEKGQVSTLSHMQSDKTSIKSRIRPAFRYLFNL